MQPRPLGSTGIAVSPLGLGTVKLGRNTGVKYPTPFDLPSDDDARDLIAAAEDLGINLIDTAPAYGTSEERLGTLLAGRRDRWVICTKAGEEFDGAQSTFDFTPRAIRASIERSLTRLRTDRIDIALLHSDGSDTHILHESGAPEALDDLKKAGKLRATGISTKTPEGALLAARMCDIVMVTLNPQHTADLPAIEKAQRNARAVLIKKALISGHTDADHSPEACLRFALDTPGVTSIIIGTINPEHLRANAAATATGRG